MSTEYDTGHFGEPTLEDEAKTYDHTGHPVKGTIIAVYPPDDRNNGQGQLCVDVLGADMERTFFRVPVYVGVFHKDTGDKERDSRETTPQRARNIYDGEAWTPEVGSLVILQFIDGIEPFVSHFCPTNFQSLPNPVHNDPLYPKQVQTVTVFEEGGNTTKEEFRSRLYPTESESPRWTRMQNGTAVEIDNRGNFNVQTTINRERIQKERYSNFDYSRAEIKETPDPEGNAVISTRGARKGNIGLCTGKVQISERKQTLIVIENGQQRTIDLTVREAVDEQNEEGNIIVSTNGASKGNVDIDTRETSEGHVTIQTAGKVTALSPSRVKVSSAGPQSYVSSSVNLGAEGGEPAVLGISLLDWIIKILMTHVHFGVERGDSTTGPPNIMPPDMLSECTFVAKTSSGGGTDTEFSPSTPGGSQSEGVSVQQSSANLPNLGLGSSNVDKMALAIMQFEGYFIGSRSERNKNPGNLMYKRQAGTIGKDDDGFAIFGTLEQGTAALKAQLELSASGNSAIYNPNMTLTQFFARYDPTSNPVGYADHVAKGLGLTRDAKIGAILG